MLILIKFYFLLSVILTLILFVQRFPGDFEIAVKNNEKIDWKYCLHNIIMFILFIPIICLYMGFKKIQDS